MLFTSSPTLKDIRKYPHLLHRNCADIKKGSIPYIGIYKKKFNTLVNVLKHLHIIKNIALYFLGNNEEIFWKTPSKIFSIINRVMICLKRGFSEWDSLLYLHAKSFIQCINVATALHKKKSTIYMFTYKL